MSLLSDIEQKIREYDELHKSHRQVKIFTGKGGFDMIMKAMNPDYTSSTTCTTTIPGPRVKRPYTAPTLLGQQLIEGRGWVYWQDNGMRWWYRKEKVFNEAPMSAGHQHLAYTLIHDPEMESIKITTQYRGNTEEEVIYEGTCKDYHDLVTIERLLNVTGDHNPRYN